MENTARKADEPKPEATVISLVKPKDVTVELAVPVQAFGATIKTLTFRRPTGADLMALGDDYPIHINWHTGEIRPNPPAMGAIMSTLAQVPFSTIQSMNGEDFSTCAHTLMGFFMPRIQAMQS
jgi:hypothetical protein